MMQSATTLVDSMIANEPFVALDDTFFFLRKSLPVITNEIELYSTRCRHNERPQHRLTFATLIQDVQLLHLNGQLHLCAHSPSTDSNSLFNLSGVLGDEGTGVRYFELNVTAERSSATILYQPSPNILARTTGRGNFRVWDLLETMNMDLHIDDSPIDGRSPSHLLAFTQEDTLHYVKPKEGSLRLINSNDENDFVDFGTSVEVQDLFLARTQSFVFGTTVITVDLSNRRVFKVDMRQKTLANITADINGLSAVESFSHADQDGDYLYLLTHFSGYKWMFKIKIEEEEEEDDEEEEEAMEAIDNGRSPSEASTMQHSAAIEIEATPSPSSSAHASSSQSHHSSAPSSSHMSESPQSTGADPQADELPGTSTKCCTCDEVLSDSGLFACSICQADTYFCARCALTHAQELPQHLQAVEAVRFLRPEERDQKRGQLENLLEKQRKEKETLQKIMEAIDRQHEGERERIRELEKKLAEERPILAHLDSALQAVEEEMQERADFVHELAEHVLRAESEAESEEEDVQVD
ncbi:hypothetical protein QR680_004329 [Steinernema hermaphroditum]|uniref:Uncharacterized protein n=1 Tax=Steinernema hermaphroditum TaxID=289476 RepID=A0AA39LT08_9BILA|nr:hypothetical protein QR680_004329 [Steinernema hermaphroditum]